MYTFHILGLCLRDPNWRPGRPGEGQGQPSKNTFTRGLHHRPVYLCAAMELFLAMGPLWCEFCLAINDFCHRNRRSSKISQRAYHISNTCAADQSVRLSVCRLRYFFGFRSTLSAPSWPFPGLRLRFNFLVERWKSDLDQAKTTFPSKHFASFAIIKNLRFTS